MADQWKVTGIRQETQLSENSDSFRPVQKVSYEVTDGPAKGTRGHVIIPQEDYRAEIVQPTIQAMVDNHQRISNL